MLKYIPRRELLKVRLNLWQILSEGRFSSKSLLTLKVIFVAFLYTYLSLCPGFGQVYNLRADSGFPFKVNITGSGPAVYLIPGLACSGDVWNTTVSHLKSHYTCYVFTLDGFGGVPKTQDRPFLKAEVKAIERYTLKNHVQTPIIIGHSLGGFLAWWLAIDAPKMWKAIVSVDGLPYVGALQNPKMTVADNQASAKQIYKMYASMSKAEFDSGLKLALSEQVTSLRNLSFIYTKSKYSDPKAVGEAFNEMMLTDLRASVGAVQCPVLQYMSAQFYKDPKALNRAKESYLAQIRPCRRAKLIVAKNARHFIFLDSPNFFFKSLDNFLEHLH